MSIRPFFLASTLATLAVAASLSGCAVETQASEETTTVDEAAKASSTGFFIVTRFDTRACTFPTCGGYFVKRVNAATTRCADGVSRPECYVAEIDYAGIGLDASETYAFAEAFTESHGLAYGTLVTKRYAPGGNVGNLAATQAWTGHPLTFPTKKASFYRVTDLGVRCKASPCPSFREETLNATTAATIASIDLAASKASDEEQALAFDAMHGADKLIVAGTHVKVTGPGGTLNQLVAQAFYTRVTHVAPAQGALCGGIAGKRCAADEICDVTTPGCGGADIAGTCRPRPELCTEEFVPVCGCDGVTYGNDCARQIAEARLDHAGACGATPPATF